MYHGAFALLGKLVKQESINKRMGSRYQTYYLPATWLIHSQKIRTIQQGLPRVVSSGGNPWQALTRFNSGNLAAVYLPA